MKRTTGNFNNRKGVMVTFIVLIMFLMASVSIAYADESQEGDNSTDVPIKLAPPKIAKPAPPKYNVLKPLGAVKDAVRLAAEEKVQAGKLSYLSVQEIAALEAEEAPPDKIITKVINTKPPASTVEDEEQNDTEDILVEFGPTGEYTSLGIFKVTHYCPCESCSGPYGMNTASGELCRPGIVAADTSVLPMHSTIYLGESKIKYVVKDVGGGVKGNHIDVFVPTHADVNAGGMYYAELFVLK